MGPSWTVTVHFFIHWVSVLDHHCGVFPGAGKKVVFRWEESPSDGQEMRKNIIALGSCLTAVRVCSLAPAETGWDPACRHPKYQTLHRL